MLPTSSLLACIYWNTITHTHNWSDCAGKTAHFILIIYARLNLTLAAMASLLFPLHVPLKRFSCYNTYPLFLLSKEVVPCLPMSLLAKVIELALLAAVCEVGVVASTGVLFTCVSTWCNSVVCTGEMMLEHCWVHQAVAVSVSVPPNPPQPTPSRIAPGDATASKS